MSLDGNTFSFIPYSLNGIGDAGLGTSYVPYTGALQGTDLNSQAIRTTNVPALANDLTNKLYVDTAITASSLLPLNNTWTGTNTFNNSVITNTTLTTNTTTVSNTLTVDTTANASLSNLVRTELNNILGGYTPATITVGNDFGTITNSLGVYQATSTTVFASLVLGTLTVSEKYSISLSLKSVDVSNVTNLYLYGSTTPNMTGSTGQLAGFYIPANTTGFTVFTNTIIFPVGSTYLLLVYYSQKPGGIDTLFWNAFSVTGMGSVVKNLIAPTTGLDATNKTYVDTADALRVPYTGSTTTVNLNSQNITTTRVPLANPDLTNKLYVDGAISAASLLPLNNTWTGTNTFNTLSAFTNQFSVVSTDVGYTGASFSASTGIGSITFASPTYTANSSASVQGIITLPALSAVYVNNPCVAVFTNLSFPVFTTAPYPYFTLTSGTTVVYTSAVNPSGTITMSFTPPSATLFVTLYFKTPPTGFTGPVFSWNTFIMSSYTATAPKLVVNGITNATQINATQVNLSGITTGDAGLQSELTNILNLNNNFRGTIITANAGIALRLDGRGGVNPFSFFYRAPTLTSATEVMTIDTAGKVGIGIGAPTEKLTVQTATENYGLIHTDGTVSVGTYCSSTNGGYVGTKSNHKFSLFTNNNIARLTIDTAGNVGIRTLTPIANFDVRGTATINNGSNSANVNNFMASGSLTIGGTNVNYGGGVSQWSSNTAGLLMECLDSTEIAVHDAGATVVSFMRYSGGIFTMGRDMGWGTANIIMNGSLAIGTASPIAKLDVQGGMRVRDGDNSKCVYGPNATWNALLVVGSGTDSSGASTAQVLSTNGNLHLDAGNNNDMYYGYYANSRGTPNPHRWFGGNYIWDSVPQATSIYEQPVMFSGNTFRRSQCVLKELYNNNSVAWGGGINLTFAFYNYNSFVQVLLTGKYSGYWTGSYTAQFGVRIYNQNSGVYYFFTFNTFTNNAYNHVTIPLTCNVGNTGIGWNDVYLYNIGGYNTDGNDQLLVNLLTLPAAGY